MGLKNSHFKLPERNRAEDNVDLDVRPWVRQKDHEVLIVTPYTYLWEK